MDFYTLPQSLYTYKEIRQILSYHDNAILHKKLSHDIIDTEALMVSHAIIYMVQGEAKVNTYEGEEIILKHGEMLFMPRDSYVVSDYLRDGENVEVFLLFFNHDIVMKFLGAFAKNTTQSTTICTLKSSQNIILFLENMMQMQFYDIHDKSLLQLKLLEFLHLIGQENREGFIASLICSEKNKQRRDITSIMIEHLDKNLRVSDFASLSGRSLSTFNKEFKQKHHKTPKQWLIEAKMKKAHGLLSEGINVTDSAFEVGYSNVSHFIKAYKSIYNETPKTMQKNAI